MLKYAYVYKIENLINGKNYIGITKERHPAARWREHAKGISELSEAIKEYGIDSFEFTIVKFYVNILTKDLLIREKEYINEYDSIRNGYNIIGSKVEPKTIKREEVANYEITKGFESFQEKTYLGDYSVNDNSRLSFWPLLQSSYMNILELIEKNNYLTRHTSKYNYSLMVSFRLRRQRFFLIETQGEEYVTDNIESIISFVHNINKISPGCSKHYDKDGLVYELKNGRNIKIYSVMLFEDELLYKERIQNIYEVVRTEDNNE